MKKFGIILLLAAGLLLAACSKPSSPSNAAAGPGKVVESSGGSYRDVSPVELTNMLQNKDFTLVNVHIPFAGNLPNTDLSIPYDTIGRNLDKLPGDKNAKIVLYCRSGSMSTTAAKELVSRGYTNIWNLAGGMYAWEEAGYKIEK